MSTGTSLKQRIRNGDVVVSLRVGVTTPRQVVETALETGSYDFVYIDGQHTAFSEDQLVSFCGMVEELGFPVQLRIPHTRQTYLIGRYLDLGPSAIMVPEVMDEEPVLEAVKFCYYPQFGMRSWGGEARYGLKALGDQFNRPNYAAWWNEQVVLAVQLESVEAVINARKLVKPGVDYLAFGPNDMMFSIEGHPEFPLRTPDECMRYVAEQVKESGTPLGMAVTTTPDEREKFIEMGITVFQESPRT